MDKELKLIKKIKKRNSKSDADELISKYYKDIYMHTNKLVDYLRSKNYKYSTKTETIEDKQIEDKTDFIVSLEEKEDVEKIQSIVNKLSAEYQEIFRLKIFLEATFVEVAEILKIPESTAKTKYYSIIKKVKDEFNKK